MKLFQKIAFSMALLAALTTQAQDQAYFEVDYPKVCLGNPVTVTLNNASDAWFYNFGDGATTNVSLPTHTYATISPAGGFKFEQIVNTFTTHIDPVTGLTENYVYYIIPITVVNVSPLNVSYKLCASGEVHVYVVDSRFDSYDIDFGDGSAVVNAPRSATDTTVSVHFYPGTTSYPIVVKGKFNAGNGCSAADKSLSVTPIATVPAPNVTFLETTQEDLVNGTLTVNFINSSIFDYSLEFKRSGFSYGQVATVPNTATSFTFNKTNTGLPSLNTKQNEYCVKVYTSTACGTSSAFDEICSVTKFTTTVADLENDLSWLVTPATGQTISSIEIDRNSSVLNTLAGSSSSYNDNTGITCATNYCYQVKAILSTTSTLGAQYSLGAKQCVTATSLTPRPALTNVNSTIAGSAINVTFDAPGGGFTAKTYTLLESVNGGSYHTAATNNGAPTQFTLTDRNPTTDSYCYQVNYTDLCNLSPAGGSEVTTCPIKVTVSLAEDGSVAINWTSYSGSTPATGYTIQVKDANGTVIKTISGGAGNTATDVLNSGAGELFYTVVADNGSTSAPVELELSPAVYIPNAFSPNGDGINDRFEIKGRFIQSVEVSVFNRWGEPVFHSTDIKNEWDGKVNGTDAMIGTYAYTVDVIGEKGETIKQRGTVSLVR